MTYELIFAALTFVLMAGLQSAVPLVFAGIGGALSAQLHSRRRERGVAGALVGVVDVLDRHRASFEPHGAASAPVQ